MFAMLEGRRSSQERGAVAVDPLHEPAPAGGKIVDELRLVKPQPLEIDQVDVGAQARREPPRSCKPKKSAVSLVCRLTSSSIGSRGPRRRSRPQCKSMYVGTPASTIEAQCAPPSLSPNSVPESVSISRMGSWSPQT